MEISAMSPISVGTPSSTRSATASATQVQSRFHEILLQILLKELPILPKTSVDTPVEGLLDGLIKDGLAQAWARGGSLSAAPVTRPYGGI